MLLRQQTLEEQTTSAAKVRVSSQELVEAISAVESRKEAEDTQQTDTIALGEAVEQLGLHTTPEELLAEIQNRRLSKVVVSPTVLRRPKRLTLIGAGLLLSLTVNLAFLWYCMRTPSSDIAIAAATPADVSTPPRAPELMQLSAVPANQIVHSDYSTIQDVAHGKDLKQVLVDVRPEQLDVNGISDLDKLWCVLKKEGHLYVRAWTSPESVLRITNGHAGHVINHTYDTTSVSVDIPIERFRNATTDGFYAPDGGSAHPAPGGNTGDDYRIPIGVALGEGPSTSVPQ